MTFITSDALSASKRKKRSIKLVQIPSCPCLLSQFSRQMIYAIKEQPTFSVKREDHWAVSVSLRKYSSAVQWNFASIYIYTFEPRGTTICVHYRGRGSDKRDPRKDWLCALCQNIHCYNCSKGPQVFSSLGLLHQFRALYYSSLLKLQ